MIGDAWQFDHFKVMTTLANIITDMVGDQLKDIPNSNGQKVFLSNYQALSAALPTIALNYQGSVDDDGYTIDSGLIEVEIEDQNNPPNLITVTTPYQDKLTNFIITIRAESMPSKGYDDKENSHRLLREIRKKLLLPKYRKTLREEAFTVVELTNSIRSTPDLISTSYHEICTMQLKLSTVDRVIDYDALSFDTINWVGNLKRDIEDTDPIILQGSASQP